MTTHLSADVLIIGGGSAGLSAALILTRARRRVLIIDSGAPRNRFAAQMHGVLGHDGASPLDLLERGRADVAGYGGEFIRGEVQSVEREGEHFRVTLDDDRRLTARAVVLATGLRDILPEIEGLPEQWGRGVATCPYCDAYEVRDRRLGSLGTGARGVMKAQMLRQWSPDVTYFLQPGDPLEPQAAAELAARGITVELSPITRVQSENGKIHGVELADGRTVVLDALFIDPVPAPGDTVLAGLDVNKSEGPHGLALALDPTGATSVPGLWAAGNVANVAATVPVSMGAGAMAGVGVNMFLMQQDIQQAMLAEDVRREVPLPM